MNSLLFELGYFSLDSVRVVFSDLFLTSSGHKNIALLAQELANVGLRVGLGAWETLDRAVLDLVILELFRVNAVRVDDGAVVLEYTDATSAVAVQVAHRVQTNVTETLQDECLVLESWQETYLAHECGLVHEVVQAVVDTLIDRTLKVIKLQLLF